jgi:hypothetical protein
MLKLASWKALEMCSSYFVLRAVSLLFFNHPNLAEKSLVKPGNTKGGSITVPLTSCLTGLESAV